MLWYGLFGFGLKWVRQTRKMILTFRGDELLLSQAQIGTINSVSFMLDSMMFVPAGYLGDRYGRKSTAVPGLAMFVVALTALNFVHGYGELMSVSVLFGLGDGITVGLMMASTADLAPAECKSEFVGAFKIYANLPQVIAPFVIGYLCTEVSIFSASILSAVIGFIALLWIACVLEDPAKYNRKMQVQ